MYFTLDNELSPTPCRSLSQYLEWHEEMGESSDWYISKTGMGFSVAIDHVRDSTVSTVYLGMNHRFDDGPPLLWETMSFPAEEICERRETYEEAMAAHQDAVRELRERRISQ